MCTHTVVNVPYVHMSVFFNWSYLPHFGVRYTVLPYYNLYARGKYSRVREVSIQMVFGHTSEHNTKPHIWWTSWAFWKVLRYSNIFDQMVPWHIRTSLENRLQTQYLMSGSDDVFASSQLEALCIRNLPVRGRCEWSNTVYGSWMERLFVRS